MNGLWNILACTVLSTVNTGNICTIITFTRILNFAKFYSSTPCLLTKAQLLASWYLVVLDLDSSVNKAMITLLMTETGIVAFSIHYKQNFQNMSRNSNGNGHILINTFENLFKSN